jgi:fructose-bisphosphate aldolase, class I
VYWPDKSRAQQAIDAVVRSANRTLVLVSGGERAGDEAMLENARQSMDADGTGLIFGHNVWQRDHEESLRFVSELREILAKYPSQAGLQQVPDADHRRGD